MRYSKLQFSKFKKFVFGSVFGELHPTHADFIRFAISSCNLKIIVLELKLLVFSTVLILKVIIRKEKSQCFLLNKNINFNKNEAESKMENSTHIFREMSLVLQFKQESQIKSKTVMSCSSQEQKKCML